MTQRFYPMLAYADASAALNFLHEAFGFEETFRMEGEHGTIAHAELELGGETLMVASVWREGGMQPPFELTGHASQLKVRVDDVDAHYRQAVAAGASVIDEPTNQEYGERNYRASDLEGHRFIFATPIS